MLLALALALALTAPAARAEADDTDATLDSLRAQITAVQKALQTAASGSAADADLQRLRGAALRAQAKADAAADALAPQLANLSARLSELGPAPSARGEAADIAAQRAGLDRSRAKVDGQLKLARLLAVEAEQSADQIYGQRRAQFQARLGERTPSVLSADFWSELSESLPRDLQRLRQLGTELRGAVADTSFAVWIGVLLVAAFTIALRLRIGRALAQLAVTRLPEGRFRRSLRALVHTLLVVGTTAVVANGLRFALSWGRSPSASLESLLGDLVSVLCFGAYVSALGTVLIAARDPALRLLPLSDASARRLQPFSHSLATVIVLGWLLERLTALANTGLASVVAIDTVFALALGLLMAHALRRGIGLWPEAAGTAPRPLWFSLLVGAAWLVLVLSLGCLLVGYVALASFVVKQVVWIGTLVGTGYLLCAVVDDGLMATVPASEDGTPSAHTLRRQGAVLLSGVARVVIVLVGVVLIGAPFGQGPFELLQQAGHVRDGIAIGELQVQPGALLQALAVFALAMWGVRVLQRWLADRYLPTTRLDDGMRASASTLVGFVGGVVAVALALSAVGLGLERIAWVASALSVGIGFGLQAVVSNFVSGLILLAERPVKVGDWVSLSGVEGDIRRINVRATEIVLGDRSTVILPNSEFITKAVRNVTLAGALGQVQIKLPMPLDTDADGVRSLLLSVFNEHPDVLPSPAPSVYIDGLDSGALVFSATGNVNSPRQAYGVKSALWFEILKRLREAGLVMSKPPTMLLESPRPGALPAAGAEAPLTSSSKS